MEQTRLLAGPSRPRSPEFFPVTPFSPQLLQSQAACCFWIYPEIQEATNTHFYIADSSIFELCRSFPVADVSGSLTKVSAVP